MTDYFLRKFAPWAGACILALLFFGAKHFDNFSQRDPDRYYHFALSRQMVDSGKLFLRELPQVEGLGWDKFFVEKEFLFHQITAQGYRVAGDKGVIGAVWLLALAGILLFYAFASGRIGPIPGFIVTGIFFLGPTLIWRLLMVRPHVLAIACFTAMVAATLRNSRWGIFFSVFFFALAYHAFYMPIVVLGASFFSYYLTRPARPSEKGEWAFHVFGIGGLLLAILINPYFPANVIAGAQIALIPSLMGGKMSSVGFGDELYPLASNAFLTGFSIPLLIFLVAIWSMSRDHRQAGSFGYKSIFLVQLMFVYLLITFQSQRGAEYLLPITAFLVIELWESRWKHLDKNTRQLILAAACLVFAWQSWAVIERIKQPDQNPTYVAGSLKAAASLPEGKEVRVFNCEWDSSPYLFYVRPNARFLDILDPSLFYFANEPAHLAREQLKRSEVADGYGLLKNAFKAEYVYCRDPVVVSQMERDPRFRRLFPKSFALDEASLGYFVYQLRPEPPEGYVKRYELSMIPASFENFRELGPSHADPKTTKSVELTYSGFLDLSREFDARAKSNQESKALCASVRPTDLESLTGAVYLSLGGGRNLRVWKNGQPLFDSEYAYVQAAMHQQIIPLGQPLKRTDRLEIVVCSAAKTNFWGLSVLGLDEKRFADICQWKRAFEDQTKPKFEFPYGRRSQTCLGDSASALSPRALR